MMTDIRINLLDDSTILEIADSLTLAKPELKDDKTMEDLSLASEMLSKLNDEIVRIEFLWPMRVLSSYTKKSGGKSTENKDHPNAFEEAIKDLPKHQRCDHFEFPNPHCQGEMVEIYPAGSDFVNDTEFADYTFQGGLFATMVSNADKIGDTWKLLLEWVEKSDTFTADCISKGGTREEIFGMPITPGGGSFYDKRGLPPEFKNIEVPDVQKLTKRFQWDLLLPIKIKE
jgi:hypothetical protein